MVEACCETVPHVSHIPYCQGGNALPPEFVGPQCAMMCRLMALAAGYQEAGSDMSVRWPSAWCEARPAGKANKIEGVGIDPMQTPAADLRGTWNLPSLLYCQEGCDLQLPNICRMQAASLAACTENRHVQFCLR